MVTLDGFQKRRVEIGAGTPIASLMRLAAFYRDEKGDQRYASDQDGLWRKKARQGRKQGWGEAA
ncbi:MAG: hypothetical protein ACLT98_08630 [Eggerthellaceae bacterium]